MDKAVTEAVILCTTAPYHGILFDVVEYVDKPGIVCLRFYAQNFADFSDNQLASIAEWINKMLKSLNAAQLGKSYTWEVKEKPC